MLLKNFFARPEHQEFDDIPSLIVNQDGAIISSNEAFNQYFQPKSEQSIKDLISIKNIDNQLFCEHWGLTWKIIYKKSSSNSKIWIIPEVMPSVWNASPVPMIWIGLDGEVYYINRAARAMFPRIREKDFISKYSDLNLKQQGTREVTICDQRAFVNLDPHYGSLLLLTVVNDFTADKQKAMQQLTSSVVHDFRNILSVIKGYGQLIRDDISQAKEYANKILATSNRAMEMVANLLSFLKSQHNPNSMIRISEILGNMEKVIRKLLGPDVKFDLIIEEQMAHVGMSEADLERIITNMVINAKEAMMGVGAFKITLQKKYFDVNWYSHGVLVRPGFYVCLRFEDNGCGITEENQAKIFSPFFTTKENGNGLGLSTILSMVQESFGAIECLSSTQKGTRFDIYLPILQSNNLETKKKRKIVVVEDSEDILEVFKISLLKQGYIVNAFTNAEDACDFIRKEESDLLITDANLPGLSGASIAELVKEQNENAKILVVSGFDQDKISNLFPSDAIFMTKPIDLSEFIKKVHNILGDIK